MIQKDNFSVTPKLFNVSEVANFFRCDPETVKRQARAGKLPGFKFGKSWFFRMRDIDDMIDGAIASVCGVQV
jgi:hypothetical protein